MNIEVIKKVQRQINTDFVDNYKGETDILKVLDLSHLKDDIDALIIEMVRQPSVYTYWANLRRISEDKYNKVIQKFEIFKARKIKVITESLKSSGVKTPTGKMIESEFHKEYRDEETYKKYMMSIDNWKERKEALVIIEKAVNSRENQFRSLSYLLSNMMNNGLLPVASKRKRQTQ